MAVLSAAWALPRGCGGQQLVGTSRLAQKETRGQPDTEGVVADLGLGFSRSTWGWAFVGRAGSSPTSEIFFNKRFIFIYVYVCMPPV